MITGPAAAGKTTLTHLLRLALPPRSGRAVILGVDVGRASARTRANVKKRIGYVAENPVFIEQWTAFDNIAMPLRMAGQKPRDYADDVRELVDFVGLGDAADLRMEKLSGAERRRAAIARALAAKPELILADDPTAGMSPGDGRRIVRLLGRDAPRRRRRRDRQPGRDAGRLRADAALAHRARPALAASTTPPRSGGGARMRNALTGVERALFWTLAFAAFAAAAAGLAARAVDRVAADYEAARSNYAIVRVIAPEGPAGIAAAEVALAQAPLVTSAAPMTAGRAAALLAQWGGAEVAAGGHAAAAADRDRAVAGIGATSMSPATSSPRSRKAA